MPTIISGGGGGGGGTPGVPPTSGGGGTGGGSTPYRVRVASTTNVPSISGLLTFGSVTVAAGDRVGLFGQSTASQNGIYVAASGAWTRATDLPVGSRASAALVAVSEGTFGGFTFQCTTSGLNDLVGTNSLTFVVMPVVSSTTPAAVSTSGSVGTGTTAARSDHVHSISGPTIASAAQTTNFTWTNLHTFNGRLQVGTQQTFSSQTIAMNGTIGQNISTSSPHIRLSSTADYYAGGTIGGILPSPAVQAGQVMYVSNVGAYAILLQYWGNFNNNAPDFLVIQPGMIAVIIYDGTVGRWRGASSTQLPQFQYLYKIDPTGYGAFPHGVAPYTSSFTIPMAGTQMEYLYKIDPSGGAITASNTTSFGSGYEGRQITFKNVSASTNPITIQLQNGIDSGSGPSATFVMDKPWQSVTLMKAYGCWLVVGNSYVGPTILTSYSDTTRPTGVNQPSRGTMIFNTDDNAPNVSDGSGWRNMLGQVT